MRALAVALAAWAALPLAVILLTGDGHFAGSDGPFPGDQLQYLAWVRDAGEHGLAGNLFDIRAPRQVFLHPLFTPSGLGWRLFGGIEWWIVIWKPVAVAVLFAGFAAYVRRHLEGAPWRTAALALALFFLAPATVLVDFDGLSAGAGEMCPACSLWGYIPTAITLGLMPAYLLLLERALAGGGRRALVGACAAGALAAWLHPWQGETLAVITGAMLLWRRSGRGVLAVALVATGLPVAYYLLLSRLDPAWAGASATDERPIGALALLVALAPLAALAAAGVRRPVTDGDRMLLLWPLATMITFVVLPPPGAGHDLEGISLPLAVLAARGAARLRAPRAAVVAAVVLLTVPGLVNAADATRRLVAAEPQVTWLADSERDALRHLEAARRPGAVLASARLGAVVPAFTGRQTWVGHPVWTPRYEDRAVRAGRIVTGQASPAEARATLAESGAAYVLTGCREARDLSALLGPPRRFGCAAVYEVASGRR